VSSGWPSLLPLARGATFLAGVLIANTVGTRQFGIYGFLQGTLTNWSQVASMSSGLLATRYLAAYGRSDPARAGQVLGYCTIVTATAGCLAGIVLWLARMSLVRNLDDAAAMMPGLSIVAAALPFACLTLFQTGASLVSSASVFRPSFKHPVGRVHRGAVRWSLS